MLEYAFMSVAAETNQQVSAFERAFQDAAVLHGEKRMNRQRPPLQGLRAVADANIENPELYTAILKRLFDLAEQIEDRLAQQHYQTVVAINPIRDNVAIPAVASGNWQLAIDANVQVFDLAGRLEDKNFGEGYRSSAIRRIRDHLAIPAKDIGQVIAANKTVFDLAGRLQDEGVCQIHQTSVIRRLKTFAEDHPNSAPAVYSKALELAERIEDPNIRSAQLSTIARSMRATTKASSVVGTATTLDNV